MSSDSEKPKVNLKQHQRFRREVPWGLIRKLVIVAVLIGLTYYLIDNLPATQQVNAESFEIEIE
ncbi:hypothetical protein DNU06_12200 [Putridiphycobacter roseus]|uniref:Uncharacterized protein n=1 Tax=Putridiphycobacter roseus TaxID=2219161 RepID=A0A2W1MWV5_9FLAO|nr:hypothetical protein [Putridiphycobacter roseus]PZE16609.1 hypothetical protein DNU06_12200 [Putridiphycobacter roseus]